MIIDIAPAPKISRHADQVSITNLENEPRRLPPNQKTPAIVFKRHELIEIRTFALTNSGEPYQMIKEDLKDECILIAKYWEEDKEKEVPAWMGAYLNNGYYKQGVKVPRTQTYPFEDTYYYITGDLQRAACCYHAMPAEEYINHLGGHQPRILVG